MNEPQDTVPGEPMVETRRRRWWQRGLAVLVIVTCLRVWVGPDRFEPVAQAQIPDAGLQRKQMLDEAQRTNQLLSDILAVLRTHTLKVRVESTDKTAATQPR